MHVSWTKAHQGNLLSWVEQRHGRNYDSWKGGLIKNFWNAKFWLIPALEKISLAPVRTDERLLSGKEKAHSHGPLHCSLSPLIDFSLFVFPFSKNISLIPLKFNRDGSLVYDKCLTLIVSRESWPQIKGKSDDKFGIFRPVVPVTVGTFHFGPVDRNPFSHLIPVLCRISSWLLLIIIEILLKKFHLLLPCVVYCIVFTAWRGVFTNTQKTGNLLSAPWFVFGPVFCWRHYNKKKFGGMVWGIDLLSRSQTIKWKLAG